jgi:hypothetical protein
MAEVLCLGENRENGTDKATTEPAEVQQHKFWRLKAGLACLLLTKTSTFQQLQKQRRDVHFTK